MHNPDEPTEQDPETEAEGYRSEEDIPDNPDTRAEGKTDMVPEEEELD